MLKFAAVVAAAAIACVAAYDDPPAINMNDGDVEFFSPGSILFDRHKMVGVDVKDMKMQADANAKASMEQEKELAAQQASASQMQADIRGAAEAKANASKLLPSQISSAEQAILNSLSSSNSPAHTKIKANNFAKIVADEKAELQKLIADAFAGLSIPSSVVSKTTNDNLAAVKTAQASLKKDTMSLASELAMHEKCAENGFMYDVSKKSCTSPSVDATKLLNKVTHRSFNRADGRDSGYVTDRYIKFTKTQDNTYIRVFWYDNMRVHGHTAHAAWNVMVCDANGNGCAHCNQPGRINMDKWSGHQHNWWMQDYMGHTVMGLCKRSENRVLGKGTYQLKVMINSNRYDIYTGHNQHSSMSVDEVWYGDKK